MSNTSRRRLALAALAAVVLPATVWAASIDPDAALAESQATIGTVVSGHLFADTRGRNVRVEDFRGRPVILSLVFTSCHHVCPTLTSELKRAAGVAEEVLGPGSFTVLTIGFDSVNDTPTRMAQYARERGIDASNWHFLSADAATIGGFTDQVGFRFAPVAGGFDHLARTTILDTEGRIYRHLYGASVRAEAFTQPLREIAIGEHLDAATLGDWLRGVKLLCTVYDPSTGRYEVDYSIFMAVATGVLCLGIAGFFLFRLWRPSVTQ